MGPQGQGTQGNSQGFWKAKAPLEYKGNGGVAGVGQRKRSPPGALAAEPGPTLALSAPPLPPRKHPDRTSSGLAGQAGEDTKHPRCRQWSPSERCTIQQGGLGCRAVGHREALTSRRWASDRWAEAGAGLREAGRRWWFPIHPVAKIVCF